MIQDVTLDDGPEDDGQPATKADVRAAVDDLAGILQRALSHELSVVEDDFTELDEDLLHADHRAAHMEDQLAGVEEQLGKMDLRMSSAVERLANVDDRLVAVESNLAAVERSQGEVLNIVKSIDKRLQAAGDIAARLDRLEERLPAR
jgi:chromosome segregation ATPase